MDISIDDVSWYTLSELFGNVLTAKQKHLGISTNAKFLNQNDGFGWGQKVCLTLTLLKKNISDPFQNDEKKKNINHGIHTKAIWEFFTTFNY